jgi:uncharacterized protein DUF3182
LSIDEDDAGGAVVLYRDDANHRAAHDHATCRAIARRLATLKGYRFAGDYDAGFRYPQKLYFVPLDTLIGCDRARQLGITGEHDLFGGVAPYPFVATKCISHPLVDDAARAPEGWSTAFASDVGDAVLQGFAAFCVDDALRAGLQLLARGPVRIKRALGIGGRGQTVAADRVGLEQALAETDMEEIERYGVALEEHLEAVTTYSVGQVRIDELLVSYCGTQRLTQNNEGVQVYGGSDLRVARGGFDALLALDHPPAVRRAIDQALRYDAAAFRAFDGLFASRRNYDVAQGVDGAGQPRSGVLEQSWRIGGASGPEVEALKAFRDDPALRSVRATSTEVYGKPPALPAGAVIHYQGDDPRIGRLTKYTLLERDVDA